jgi:ribosomal peptide maturation radical SAM protein 1
MPGLVSRSEHGDTISVCQHAPVVTDLDALPYPDYDDYFLQVGENSLDLQGSQIIGFHTSRGCWYGEKQRCLFCSWPGEEVRFRSKSPKRVLDEIMHLSSLYRTKNLFAVDSILDMRYLNDLLPEIIQRDLKLNLYFEIKSNLQKDQFQLLKEAGVKQVQPGIESLSTKTLKLMRKGCTALQNIQTLKWASELGIVCQWNFLWGIPGECEDEYSQLAEMVPSLFHLQPPMAIGPIRFQRFSPYFEDPDRYGFINIRPSSIYQALFPFDEAVLENLAFYFDYDYRDGRDPSIYTQQLEEQLMLWKENFRLGTLTAISNADTLIIQDQRPVAQQSRIELKGIEKAIYEFCDTAHSLTAINRAFVDLGYAADQNDLRALLDNLADRRLMLSDGDWYLSLAVFVGGLVEQVSDSQIIQQALAGEIYKLSEVNKEEADSG